MKNPELKVSTFKDEGPYQASKWLHIRLLIDLNEMKSLIEYGPAFYIYSINAVYQNGAERKEKEEFLQAYGEYIKDLKEQRIPDEAKYRDFFSAVFTTDPESLYRIQLDQNKYLVKIRRPVIQLQTHRIAYSTDDQRFRSMVIGETISWGLQFKYPQIFQNPKTQELEKIDRSFSDSLLFHEMQKWTRNHTIPTTFEIHSKKITETFRIGRSCLAWINEHPQLKEKNIRVAIS